MDRDSATLLAPGFRFHPTDEELVWYYLKRKVSGKSFRFDPVSVVDIYKTEPWDLPGKSKLKTRDLEWYFFSALDKKYGNSLRTNRATEKGYWKTTGKDRPVRHNSRTVGMKKTLVFHSGRAPSGARTNWVMHEYRLENEELNTAGISQDAFVLCRVFQKSGTGPKNGEQYGAPFIEEEWEDDENLAFIPGHDLFQDEVVHGNDVYLEDNHFDQNHEEKIISANQVQSNFCYGSTSNFVGESNEFIEDEQKPIVSMNDTSGPFDTGNFFVLPECEVNGKRLKNKYFSESSDNVNPMDVNYMADEPFLCASDSLSTDGLYLEPADLMDSRKVDSVDFDVVEEYLTFFDEDNNNADTSFDPSEILGREKLLSDLPDEAPPLTEKVVDGANGNASMESKHLSEFYRNNTSCSKQKTEASKLEPDTNYPLTKKVNDTLGCIPAPLTYTSVFPSKDAIRQLHIAAQASTSVHVTAGIIEISSTGLRPNGMDYLFGKNMDFNLILSFGLSETDAGTPSLVVDTGLLPCQTGSLLSRGFFCFFMLFWVLILSVSFKVGSCIYSR